MVLNRQDRQTNQKKKFLSKLWYIKRLIASNEEKIKDRRSMLKHNIKPIDYAKEQIKGGNKYSWDNLIYEIDNLEREIIDNTVELVKTEREIFDCIKNVEDLQYRLLLQYRYFDCKDWLEIDHLLKIEANTRNRKHSEALKAVKIDKLSQKVKKDKTK